MADQDAILLESLDFPLEDLNALTNVQLCLVQFHSDATDAIKTRAELIFWRRRNKAEARERSLALHPSSGTTSQLVVTQDEPAAVGISTHIPAQEDTAESEAFADVIANLHNDHDVAMGEVIQEAPGLHASSSSSPATLAPVHNLTGLDQEPTASPTAAVDSTIEARSQTTLHPATHNSTSDIDVNLPQVPELPLSLPSEASHDIPAKPQKAAQEPGIPPAKAHEYQQVDSENMELDSDEQNPSSANQPCSRKRSRSQSINGKDAVVNPDATQLDKEEPRTPEQSQSLKLNQTDPEADHNNAHERLPKIKNVSSTSSSQAAHLARYADVFGASDPTLSYLLQAKSVPEDQGPPDKKPKLSSDTEKVETQPTELATDSTAKAVLETLVRDVDLRNARLHQLRVLFNSPSPQDFLRSLRRLSAAQKSAMPDFDYWMKRLYRLEKKSSAVHSPGTSLHSIRSESEANAPIATLPEVATPPQILQASDPPAAPVAIPSATLEMSDADLPAVSSASFSPIASVVVPDTAAEAATETAPTAVSETAGETSAELVSPAVPTAGNLIAEPIESQLEDGTSSVQPILATSSPLASAAPSPQPSVPAVSSLSAQTRRPRSSRTPDIKHQKIPSDTLPQLLCIFVGNIPAGTTPEETKQWVSATDTVAKHFAITRAGPSKGNKAQFLRVFYPADVDIAAVISDLKKRPLGQASSFPNIMQVPHKPKKTVIHWNDVNASALDLIKSSAPMVPGEAIPKPGVTKISALTSVPETKPTMPIESAPIVPNEIKAPDEFSISPSKPVYVKNEHGSPIPTTASAKMDQQPPAKTVQAPDAHARNSSEKRGKTQEVRKASPEYTRDLLLGRIDTRMAPSSFTPSSSPASLPRRQSAPRRESMGEPSLLSRLRNDSPPAAQELAKKPAQSFDLLSRLG